MIVPVGATSGVSTGSSVTTGSRTWTAGNIVVCGFHGANGATAVNSISASGGAIRAFGMPAAIRNSSPALETWIVFIDTGFTGTLTGNLSGSDNSVFTASEYSGVTGFGVGNSSAPTSTANPSISLTFSDAVGAPWTVAVFSANSATNPTANVGNLRVANNQTNVTGALVDNVTNTCSVTHASANWGIGIIELYDGGSDLGNGVYSLGGAGGGTNGYGDGYNGFTYGVGFTTGSNPAGYTLNSASIITNNMGSGAANLRAAVYDDDADPGKDLVADGGNLPFGVAAGAGAGIVHVSPLSGTLLPNTNYWATFNNDTATVAYRFDDSVGPYTGTSAFFVASTFGTPPNPWGSRTQEDSGGHIWVHVTPIVVNTPRGILRDNDGVMLRSGSGRLLRVA